ncbi:peptidoglycan bridge formation glycyltransferase FemA/FemB family protein [Streptomyces sp. NPDC006349]|uniref:lipid II:glycine glycyltransferase FemX n=1 Tax=Streptomyces sp. NPDC006349 TaxID=3156757 RepID=UPI0006B8DAA1|nr:peptidoglycan bridge formation protein FemAB [Streptomyces sp. NRRL WC-3753]
MVQTSQPHRALELRTLPRERYAAYVRTRSTQDGSGEVGFLQCPSWADVKEGWRPEYLGWFDEAGSQEGAALVLFRQMPGVRRYFAYIPEGPVLDWATPEVGARLELLLDHLRDAGAFAVRMGPPLTYRRWSAATLKNAVGPGRRLGDVLPDVVDPLAAAVADRLREAGWRRCREDGQGGGDAQPRYVFEMPLGGRKLEDVWSGLNQEWRRNIKKATKADVESVVGDNSCLPAFYALLQQTEQRDGFRLGRSLEYFERQYQALNAEEPGRMRLYLACHEGEVLAAHTLITLGRRAWYLTGASAGHRREVRPSNALQWRMIRDAHARGVVTYDMRGVPDTLDPEVRAFGLMRWKLGTGGRVAETMGEWELPLQGAVNKTLHRAMHVYLTRR